MSNYFATPLEFILATLLQLFIAAVLVRFLLQWARASFYNPVAQLVVKVTNPLLKPLRRVIPGLFGVDVASLVLAYTLAVVTILLVGYDLEMGRLPGVIRGELLPFVTVAVGSVEFLVRLVLNIFLFSLFIQALLSWVQQGYSPVAAALHDLNEPVLRPFRRIIPPVSGFDFSVLAAMLFLFVLKMLLLPPLRDLAVLGHG